MSYVVEVDQSGKIGETDKPTVLAFAGGKERAILIPAGVKRQIISQLRQLGKGDALYYGYSLPRSTCCSRMILKALAG